MMILDPSGLRLELIVPRGRMNEEERALPNPRSRDWRKRLPARAAPVTPPLSTTGMLSIAALWLPGA